MLMTECLAKTLARLQNGFKLILIMALLRLSRAACVKGQLQPDFFSYMSIDAAARVLAN